MSKQLSEEEAREFLRLLDAVEEDMEEVFEIVGEDTFSDGEVDIETVVEEWGASPGQLYTEFSRNKYRQFVKHAYLEDTDASDDQR